ncbi:MAG: hypothetical protein OEY28_08095, partial [Nitrospira sp.]|nr:hypothetical protein [Nitrospira sp.]
MAAHAIVAYTSPFQLIFRDQKDQWDPSLQQINENSYDYVKLHRLSTSLDIGLPKPLCMHITFDGALILPRIEQFGPIEKAVAAFNKVLGAILLGGIYFDSVQPTDIDQGILYTSGYYRALGQAKGFPGQLRYGLQARIASPLHSILLHNPAHLFVKDIHVAHKKGVEICSRFDILSVEFLLKGISCFVAHDWAGSLSHLWISLEQVVSCLWKEQVIVGGVQPRFPIEKRKEFLEDYRTWVTSTRLEVLFQRGILSESAYRNLNKGRKSRNELAHRGITPTRQAAESVLDGLFQVMAAAQVVEHTPSLDKILKIIKRRD